MNSKSFVGDQVRANAAIDVASVSLRENVSTANRVEAEHTYQKHMLDTFDLLTTRLLLVSTNYNQQLVQEWLTEQESGDEWPDEGGDEQC